MRKTDLRSRSFNVGSNGPPLFKTASANTNYYVASNEEDENDEENSEYEAVRRQSSATSSSSSVTDSGDLSASHRPRHHLLSPTTIHEPVAHQRPVKAPPQRRHSQQPISSPRLLVSAPEFVITSASKIPQTSTAPRRSSPPSSSSYSRDDTPDFSIYSYEDEEEETELRYAASQLSRRKTIQLEHEPLPQPHQKDENERRWSSDSSRRRRGSQEIEAGQYRWNNSKQDRYREQRDPYYRNRETDQAPARRRNTIVPPPAIVTNPAPVPVSPYRRLSAGATALLPVEPKTYFCQNKNVNLLSVPGYDSPSTSPSVTPTITRSRSQSTPSSPELIRLQATTGRSDSTQEETDYYYKKEKRRSLSPDRRSDSREDDMHSPYHRQRSSDHIVENRSLYYEEDDSCGDERMRKHSYADVPSGRSQRSRQAELRRISSSATCVVEGPDSHRRRILPPTPDQLPEKAQRGHINSVQSRPYERTSGTSVASSLPSQPAPASTFSRSAGYDGGGEQAHQQMNSNSRSSSSRQIVSSTELASAHVDHRKEDEQLLHKQRVPQFGEDIDEEAVRCSMRRARRATTIAETSMIPAASVSPQLSNSSRSGRGRKLPETPDASKTTPPSANKMIPYSIARQNTVGELVHQPPSPPSLGRFHAPSRRVSEQIFVQRTSKTQNTGLLAQSSLAKSPSTDNDDHSASGVIPAWTAPSKSPDRSGAQMAPSRSKLGILNQFRQSSVSSSSSVPDLITTPTNNAGVGAGPATDGATDSGHGSGAESGVGDGATVSGSNSWPDAIGIGGLNLGTFGTAGSTPTSTVSSGGAEGLLTPSSSGLGLLHFTVQYFPVRKRLRVSVIKAERLAGQLRMELELNTFVKVCLMPGKLQKQRGSRIVKRTRDATFNEEFFFDNVTPEDLESKSVLLRLCHHVGKQFQKDVVIGQLEISLRDIMNQLLGKHELKLCQELKPKQLKKLGRLQISTCLESDARRLTINIFKVDDLPKFGISGPPDPCVRICVDQNGKVQTKQSRTLKSTCNAVFKEAVMFLVSTKREDLERTKIIVTVHDTARSASGDDVIGNAYLGQLACDKTELEQWRNTLTHPGREFKATHQLKKEPVASGDDDLVNCNED